MLDCAEGYPRVRWDRSVGQITDLGWDRLCMAERGGMGIVVGNVLA